MGSTHGRSDPPVFPNRLIEADAVDREPFSPRTTEQVGSRPWSTGRDGTDPRFAAGYDPHLPVRSTEGVLTRRLFAYLIDIFVIACLTILFGLLIGIAGIFTFGLTWLLYAILVPGTAILYSALSVGGSAMGTFGMRVSGLVARSASTGGRVGFVPAGLHALLFYVGIGTFLLFVLDIVIGLARSDRRLGHDLLTDVVIVRR
jgi:uncharacterized RDD family membrane protein YckC